MKTRILTDGSLLPVAVYYSIYPQGQISFTPGMGFL